MQHNIRAIGARGIAVRILIAEDDAALSEALRFTLSQAGYAVDLVGHGLAADEALKGDGFGLLILDLGLPKLDGLEVLRRLRKRNTTLPVLILSGREQPEEKVAGLDLGADDYLVKPFSLWHFFNTKDIIRVICLITIKEKALGVGTAQISGHQCFLDNLFFVYSAIRTF